MDEKVVAKYFNKLKERHGYTIEAWAEMSNGSASTLKNLLLGKTEDPRVSTIRPYIYAVGGSFDEMLNPDYKKDDTRLHYEHHIIDIKESHAREMALKDEIIKSKDETIKSKDSNLSFFKILACIGLSILIGLLILEVANPNLGWLRF